MVAVALPMVVSLACDTVMVFTDRLFLSRLSPELMNASMGGGLTVFMMSSFFVGLFGYVTALTAQYLGAGRKRDCATVVTQAVALACLGFPMILAARPLAYALFEFMGVGAGQLGPQIRYLNILVWGTGISLLRTVLSGFFSGVGRSSVVMTASSVAMLANVGLGYALIFGKFGCPAYGIEGAGWATVASGGLGLGILTAAYLSKQNRREFQVRASVRVDLGVAGKLLRFGSPAGFEMFLNMMAFNTLVLIFHSHNAETATAATVVFNWDMVSFLPLIGLEVGVTSLVGRFMGAERPEIAQRSAMAGLKLGLVYSALVVVLFVGFPGQLVGVFLPSPADVRIEDSFNLAVWMIRLASLYVLVEAVLIVFIGALRGAGDTLWAMGISVSVHWITVGALYVILRVLKGSPEAGWTAVVSMFVLFSGLVYARYQNGKWKQLRVVQREPGWVPGGDVPEVF